MGNCITEHPPPPGEYDTWWVFEKPQVACLCVTGTYTHHALAGRLSKVFSVSYNFPYVHTPTWRDPLIKAQKFPTLFDGNFGCEAVDKLSYCYRREKVAPIFLQWERKQLGNFVVDVTKTNEFNKQHTTYTSDNRPLMVRCLCNFVSNFFFSYRFYYRLTWIRKKQLLPDC